MQPFCTMGGGSAGGSNVRSPRPSETKTITFSNPPLESAITSSDITGVGCSLAQLGSAAMLMRVGLVPVPSNLTVPLTSELPVDGAAPETGRDGRNIAASAITGMKY